MSNRMFVLAWCRDCSVGRDLIQKALCRTVFSAEYVMYAERAGREPDPFAGFEARKSVFPIDEDGNFLDFALGVKRNL